MQEFHTANGCFPPGLPSTNGGDLFGYGDVFEPDGTVRGPNWEIAILPQIEQPALYQDVLNCIVAAVLN